MNAEAIYRVTQALRARLEAAVAASGDPGTVFVGPLDDPDATASLILFLYRMVPNASLRNREHRVVPVNPPPPAVVFQNSLPLDLYYLVTVGTRYDTASEAPLLRVLGYAMQALQAEPELTGPDVAYETVHVSLEPLSTDDSGRIWSLFPQVNFRTSVAYLATPVWIDPPNPRIQGAPVVEDSLDAGVASKAAAA